jgi:hypothetical protein
VDFLVELEKDFKNIVIENLSKKTRTGIEKLDKETPPVIKKDLRKEVTGTVLGKYLIYYESNISDADLFNR